MGQISIWHWVILLLVVLIPAFVVPFWRRFWARKLTSSTVTPPVGAHPAIASLVVEPTHEAKPHILASNHNWIFDKPYERNFVFISYSSKDQARAMEIVADIEKRGTKCWIAPRDIPAGSDYQRCLTAAIEYCGAVLLLFSKDAQDSDHVSREISLAQHLKRPVVPARLDSFQAVGAFILMLVNLHWIDLQGGRSVPLPLFDPPARH